MARKHHVPWNTAGTASETEASTDDVVRTTGWVFNNVTGSDLDLAQFVASGDMEVEAYTEVFGLTPGEEPSTLVEIGAGIGRMTAAFTRAFSRVIACDLDAAFLERCRQTVAKFGDPERLDTVWVEDGQTLSVDDGVADVTFSYITLQHCERHEAIELTREAVRVTRPGGKIALNYRTWTAGDTVLWPAGATVRGLWKVPGLGRSLARARTATRLGWQANRLGPQLVIDAVGDQLTDVHVYRSPRRRTFAVEGTIDAVWAAINRSHWWLVATKAA
jgi:SAM-dependent methyltransferase